MSSRHLVHFLLILVASVHAAAAERRPAQSQPAVLDGIRSVQVSCPTEDEVKVAGTFTPAVIRTGQKAPVAILLHTYGSDRTAWEPLVPTLHAAGFAVLAIDFRGHGETTGPEGMQLTKRSEKKDTRLFRQMYKDVQGAYNWLTTRNDVDLARFVLIGCGLGCSVAIDCGGHDRSIDCIVCIAPQAAYLGLDSLADAAKYGNRQMLLLCTPEEKASAQEIAQHVKNAKVQEIAAKGSGEEGEVVESDLLGKVAGLEQTVAGFAARAAGQPSSEGVVASTNSDVYHQPDSVWVQRIKAKNLRRFSSPAEAEARGLRASRARSGGSGRNPRSADE